MQTILDQSEIDQLFAEQGPSSADGLPLPEAAQGKASLFNFGGAGQISNEQMRAISLVNDQFARNVMHTLGAWLRTQTSVTLVAGEQMPYGEFLSRIPEPAFVCLLRLEPLGGVGLLEIDLALALTVVDLLLGGGGGAGITRDVTDIESAILASVIEVIVRELNAAWDKVGLHFTFAHRDHDGKVPRLMPSGERTLCVSFDMQLLGVQGMLNFCLPAVVLNTVHRRLLALSDEAKPKRPAITERVSDLMSGSTFKAVLRLPTMRIPSASLRRLKPGTVLELPLPRHAQSQLIVGGVRMCGAFPVARDMHRGAMIAGASRSAVFAEGSTEPASLTETHNAGA